MLSTWRGQTTYKVTIMEKPTSIKAFTLLLGALTLLSSSQLIAGSKSIEQVIKSYERYLNASDPQSIMTLYSNNPIFMPQHSFAQEGRTKVRKAYDAVFSNINLNIKFTIYEIKKNGRTAWARTSSTGKTTILANGMKTEEGNNELFIFKQENNEWKIHRYLFSTTTPRQQ